MSGKHIQYSRTGIVTPSSDDSSAQRRKECIGTYKPQDFLQICAWSCCTPPPWSIIVMFWMHESSFLKYSCCFVTSAMLYVSQPCVLLFIEHMTSNRECHRALATNTDYTPYCFAQTRVIRPSLIDIHRLSWPGLAKVETASPCLCQHQPRKVAHNVQRSRRPYLCQHQPRRGNAR